MNEVRIIGFRQNSRGGLLEFSFGENRKECCDRNFPVAINHENVESFRIVSVNSTAQKIQAMFFRTCSGGHVSCLFLVLYWCCWSPGMFM